MFLGFGNRATGFQSILYSYFDLEMFSAQDKDNHMCIFDVFVTGDCLFLVTKSSVMIQIGNFVRLLCFFFVTYVGKISARFSKSVMESQRGKDEMEEARYWKDGSDIRRSPVGVGSLSRVL